MVVVYWYISDFFTFVASLVKYIFNFLGVILDLFVDCIDMFGSIILSIPTRFFITSLILVILSIFLKILGREGGGD